jgi:DNA-binding IclR family transcriptional regulator
MEETTNGRVLSTTETSLRVIETLGRLDGGRVTEVAEALDLAPSTVHAHLSTLERNRYLVKRGDEYRLGLRFLNLGEFVRQSHEHYALARAAVEQLAEETGGRTHFIVEEHGQGVYLAIASGPQAIDTYSREGKRLWLHQSAGGKAILAALPDERVRAVVDRWGLAGRTENSITDVEALFDCLERVRERDGIAFNEGEQTDGIRAVGAPVRGPDGAVVGALSVSGPAHRLKGDYYRSELPDTILGTANELELRIKLEADGTASTAPSLDPG